MPGPVPNAFLPLEALPARTRRETRPSPMKVRSSPSAAAIEGFEPTRSDDFYKHPGTELSQANRARSV